ncbi:MAG: transketolase [Alphaproteobacteria bacterium]
MANAIRALAMDAVQKAKSGHPGMPMGMADVATVLFTRVMKYDPAHPEWPDRDRFVLSAGHGSMLLYAALYLTGYADMTIEEIKNFRQLGARTAGHPEYGHAGGIETTTGPLGQGLANGVGMAMAEKLLAARYGRGMVDHFTYVIAGDGCLMEGISHEAISLAGHLKLDRLIVLFDDNGISIDGPTDMTVSDDQLGRFRASGWHVQSVDGHDQDAVLKAIEAARASDAPSLIACKTVIGFGAPSKAGTAATHGAPLGEEEIAGAREELGWPYPPFEVPDDVLRAWREAGRRGTEAYREWQRALDGYDRRAEFERVMRGDAPDGLAQAIQAFKEKIGAEKPIWATRKASGEVLSHLGPVVPELIGGSADLTGSNLTRGAGQATVTPDDFSGSYIHYGVREHAMAAAMNGMALHGGLIPYGGTFLVFTDYCRASIRLSALMGLPVVYVMTHDSIGLGEDGPTHQPVEHLASLRAIPNLSVFRPADPIETAECWALALSNRTGPSVLALSRQGTPVVREATTENLSSRGGYVLAPASGERQATILSTGTEIPLALEARRNLEAAGIPTAVVSMVSWELFETESESYRASVLGPRASRVAIEAAAVFGWSRYVESEDDVIGMRGFGASAPAEELYAHFGITAEAVVQLVKRKLRG